MSRSFHSYAAIGIVIFTIVFEVAILILFVDGFINGEIDSTFSVVTALATLTMALCSAFNVIVILKQSESMELQLVEMQKERELRDNCLPWIDEIAVFAGAPSLSRDSNGKYGCYSNYYVDLTLQNLSQNPILSLDVTVSLTFPLSKYSEITSAYISVIPGSSKTGTASEFCCEETAGLYTQHAKSNAESYYPQLQTKLTYRTFSGGYFTLTNHYLICLPDSDEDLETLITWGRLISTVNLTSKDEINTINEFAHKNMRDEALNIWKNVCEKRSIDSLSKESIRLRVREFPGSFDIKKITPEEYKEATSKHYIFPLTDIPKSTAIRNTRFRRKIKIQ